MQYLYQTIHPVFGSVFLYGASPVNTLLSINTHTNPIHFKPAQCLKILKTLQDFPFGFPEATALFSSTQ